MEAKDASEKPAAAADLPHHDRTVNNAEVHNKVDDSTKQPTDENKNQQQQPPPPPCLDDIISSNAGECEADTHLIQSLESSDSAAATTTTSGDTTDQPQQQPFVLSNIPEGMSFQADDSREAQTRRTRRGGSNHQEEDDEREFLLRSKLHDHEPPMVDQVAVDLASLEGKLRAVHGSTPHTLVGEHGKGDADKFMKNAHDMFSSSTKKHQDGKQRWKKLGNIVRAASPSEGAHTEPENGHENEDVETGQEAGSENSENDSSDGGNLISPLSDVNQGLQDFKFDWSYYYKSKRKKIANIFRIFLLWIILPATAVSVILFYWAGNPPTGYYNPTTAPPPPSNNNTNSTAQDDDELFSGVKTGTTGASASWWLLFVFVRQPLTLMLAMLTQGIVIDFLCVRTRVLVRCLGSVVSLFIIQSKGWPFIVFFWGVYDIVVLWGSGRFARHWLFWQSFIEMCNETNPAGTVLESATYGRVLLIFLITGFLTASKRYWVATFLGKQCYVNYSKDLVRIMDLVLVVSEVARLGRDLEIHTTRESPVDLGSSFYQDLPSDDDSMTDDNSNNNNVSSEQADNSSDASSDSVVVMDMLDKWEEPELPDDRKTEHVPLKSFLQFRTSFSLINSPYPFSQAFGKADTREACLESSNKLYKRLLSGTTGDSSQILHFNTIAVLAKSDDGDFDREKLEKLIRVFRPDRQGNMTILDFDVSIDDVYKQMRILRASVLNSYRMDKSFESLINAAFGILLICLILWVLQVNPWALFAAVTSVVIAFAFMIGQAASRYFNGVLMVLAQRPYDIGDKIAVNQADVNTDQDGSLYWVVKDVNLYSTTVIYTMTNEYATYPNGSLAVLRIINAARSPKAIVAIYIKFPIRVSDEKVSEFRQSLISCIKARPREWLSMTAFRQTLVESDLGYVQYRIIFQHRQSWQQHGAVLNSKAALQSYAVDMGHTLGIRYVAPPLPVDLSLTQQQQANNDDGTGDDDNDGRPEAGNAAGHGAGQSFVSLPVQR